ncbi:hypothetical protein C2S53_000584 [Perilla frutescens var. hirtella]|uniref:F-box domain-containing protein n=1 Tax=Perilla frutescens var. hirtella TaxID=608512 RepID=A0AAD4IYW8_PERFH|nr:hypothetical protein C2S53_000584 [Perilla frutescens var. hirtella]
MAKSVHLPEEVIEVILSKSPIKSVVRFKSVSKSWESIISNPRFSRIHRLQRSKASENQNMFIMWAKPIYQEMGGSHVYVIKLQDGKFITKSVFYYPYPRAFPMCYCNGIFILITEPIDHDYMLLNVAIHKHIVIRGPLMPGRPKKFHFYHDSTDDDYKFVLVSLKYYTVYSCRNSSWGEMKDLPCDVTPLLHGASVDECFYGLCGDEVVCFNARDGKLDKFRQPKDVIGKVELTELSGRLCLHSLVDRRKLHLWLMEKKEKNGRFEKCWRKLISMEKEEGEMWLFRPVCLINEDDVVLRLKVGWNLGGSKRFVYKIREKRFEEVEFNWKCITPTYPYSENLYLPSSNILE